MDVQRGIIFAIFCWMIASVLGLSSGDRACAETICPGPLHFYREFNCTPLYKNADDCCAFKYNCDHLDQRAADKCYVNGDAFNIGEILRKEEFSCDFQCVCHKNEWDTVAKFACLISDYAYYMPSPNCYVPRTVDCRQHDVVCPNTPEERPTCLVDGKVYKDGEEFSPEAEPNKLCFCGANYTGENIAPFCKIRPPFACNSDLYHEREIKEKCAPVYDEENTRHKGCISDWICPNHNNVIPRRTVAVENNVTCQLGNLTMQFGDEFHQKMGFRIACVKCICEVGPYPTCLFHRHTDGTDVDCNDPMEINS